nr:MAG TPA: hypothetical protein [Caudoviricetes sp.]
MYSDFVTIFNSYESPTTGEIFWYPHMLQTCDLITDSGAIRKKYGQESIDSAMLHVRYYEGEEEKVCFLSVAGDLLPYRTPKEWKKQTNDLLPNTVTFSENDFFIRGIWTGGNAIVSDDDYRGGFYQHVNNLNDNVFKVSSVGGPYTVIPHFEILGK